MWGNLRRLKSQAALLVLASKEHKCLRLPKFSVENVQMVLVYAVQTSREYFHDLGLHRNFM